MAAADARHQGSGRVAPRWGVPVALLPDELLSSWLARAALFQGCDPLVFTGSFWPRWRVWTLDADRGVDTVRLQSLADVSGIEQSRLEAATLRRIAEIVAGCPLDKRALWPWILALGSRNRNRYGGLQYCPECFLEDRKPYYRVQWRLAWHTVCAAHACSLADRCFQCKAPLEPHRLLATDGCMAFCASCKGDLSRGRSPDPPAAAAAFQAAADRAVALFEAPFGEQSLAASEWFALARYFACLLRKAAVRRGSGFSMLARSLGVDTDALTPTSTGLPFELLPVSERTSLLSAIWTLLCSGPRQFLQAAAEAPLTQSAFRERRQPAPPALDAIVAQLPESRGRIARRTVDRRAASPRPKSREQVLRLVARLQRRARLAPK